MTAGRGDVKDDPSEFGAWRVEQLVRYGDYEALLRDLLAVIHRDGGHYTERHGMVKAFSDAMALSAKRLP